MQSGPISSTLSDIRDFAACPNTPKLQAADLSAGVGESAVRTPTMFAVSRRTLPSLDTLRTQLAINKKLNTLISAAFAFLFLSTGSDDRPRHRAPRSKSTSGQRLGEANQHLLQSQLPVALPNERVARLVHST